MDLIISIIRSAAAVAVSVFEEGSVEAEVLDELSVSERRFLLSLEGTTRKGARDKGHLEKTTSKLSPRNLYFSTVSLARSE
jgi:hypothetical protein